ncbi:hypothetical protein RQP53_16505 [Paucibacter sp. APW11]|uniref:EVE domain-containing protein n=1 Tax=Roseateles aquae TaxID=3077235 RepID=A0ABU3PE98_9BURK|nr:hypothetical protein [Paucibacter sp. APW11]MDT9000879.1 hypothetical protein [Paucibacter sp. APW11]
MFVLKTEIADLNAKAYHFARQKTMYGGKLIQAGDTVFIFASENSGGPGLIARATASAIAPTPRLPGIARQTPRLSLQLERNASAMRRLGRAELKPFAQWDDGRPETELNFKLYRQATDKLIGISAEAAEFLQRYF